MTYEKLEKGQYISNQIEKCKENIKLADYTQNEEVFIRCSYLKFNGIDESIEIPKELFRIIGKLIKSEYELKLIELCKEFDSL